MSRRDVSSSLPGVAVAIALVPPLSLVGISAQAGAWDSATGALVLFLTDLLAILLAGGLTFVLTGVVPLVVPVRPAAPCAAPRSSSRRSRRWSSRRCS